MESVYDGGGDDDDYDPITGTPVISSGSVLRNSVHTLKMRRSSVTRACPNRGTNFDSFSVLPLRPNTI